jgi:hypothetical protein
MFAALVILMFAFALAWLVWMVFFLAQDPGEEIRQTKHLQFFGPGGPDDPFADDSYDD